MNISTITLSILLALSSVASMAGDKHKHDTDYVKPGAPIGIVTPDAIHLDPYTDATIEIEFFAPERGTLQLVTRTKSGLRLTSARRQTLDLANAPAKIRLSLSAQASGRYHVMFHATMPEEKGPNSRVFGIPVYVGDTNANTKVQQKASPRHIILPAQETIRQEE